MIGHWWLVTWVTYGSWLPGDPRGFKTWRKREYVPPVYGTAQPDELTYNPDDYKDRLQHARQLCPTEIRLSGPARRICCDAIRADIAEISIAPAILAVATQHVHLIAKFGDCRIRPTVGRMKFAATQQLHLTKIIAGRIWAKGCHMESLPNQDAFEQAFHYVADHESEGAHLLRWKVD